MNVRLHQSKGKLPLSKALLWILLSVLLVSGTAFMGWLYYLHVKDRRFRDDHYRIAAIVKKGPNKDPLPTTYLAELLGLSADRAINLFQFDVKEGVRKLIASPIIKRAEIKKIVPGTLLVEYQMRHPIAALGNFSNTVLDAEGLLIPYRPFYSFKELPDLYVSVEGKKIAWGASLHDQKDFLLALDVLKKFKQIRQYRLKLKRIDVSSAFADSLGQREIVVILENMETKRNSSLVYLRLHDKDYEQNIANYMVLRSRELLNPDGELEKVKVIDFRIPNLAFIRPLE